MAENKMEIWFSDLSHNTKIEVLNFFNVQSSEELNYDTQPMFILEREEDDETGSD